jgi:UDP-glucose 4-epimerase
VVAKDTACAGDRLMDSEPMQAIPVYITGASGYLGGALLQRLAAQPGRFSPIAADVRPCPEERRIPGVTYVVRDVRDPALLEDLRTHGVQRVVHLASILAPTKDMDRAFLHSVDVQGTENVVQACVAAGVTQLIVTSSGAAYGYYADNNIPLTEDDPLRGNPEFAYSDHKRQVEELLARYRAAHPELKQLILRPGTVIGAGTRNQITALFEKRVVLGISGSDTPFVFIWDEDVANILVYGLEHDSEGIYNLAGDGALPLREIATRLGKPYVPVPAAVVRGALRFLRVLGATEHGPEQVNFLRYRPVLANNRLKEVLGYIPAKTSREAFEYYLAHAQGPTGP